MRKAVIKYKKNSKDEFLSLKECQQYLIRLLEKFSLFCRDYKIDFFLLWGSLLGAKRNSKIIPWDDDIDIGVTDEVFAKLLHNAPHLHEYGIDYLHFSKNSKMYSNEIRLFIPGFYKIQETNFNQYMTPVCIDVFIANKINKDINPRKKLKLEFKLKKTINILIKKEAIWRSKTTFKYLLRYTQKIFYIFYPTKYLHKKLEKMCNSLYDGCGQFEYCFPETLHNQKSWLKTYKSECFDTLESILFENIHVSIPSLSDEILKLNYGEWEKPIDRTGGEVFNERFFYRKNAEKIN